MSADRLQKITTDHLRRDAFLYVRQSSLRQVMENTESTKRQYALRDRAIALGWPIERIHVIDSDLGLSGAHAQDRDGFQYLVSEVANGHAGIVLGLEVSRLARNNADWHRLIELSALSQTLILDEDGIYDPAHFNDRLLLGLKGAMSEAELHVLKARLQGGIRNKARRGELEVPLPIGLVYHPDGSVVLDPDAAIRAAIQLVFDTFRHTRSATSTVKRFRREGWLFPRRIRRGIGKGEVMWGTMEHCRVIQVLHNPRYAGAFVYGRTRGAYRAAGKQTSVNVPREDWQVLIRDAHAGYIDWEEFERNQVTLKQNAAGFGQPRGGLPREGKGLLQGRVVCGICGARMRVRYQEVAGRLEPYYMCTENAVRRAGKPCQSIRGRAIDDVISALLLDRVAPTAIEVALAVEEEISGRIAQAQAQRTLQMERARYDAELARRRYLHVDPSNRLVADTLEADWNERLRHLDLLQQEQDRQQQADQKLLSAQECAQIRQLAEDFPRIWNDNRVAPLDRKRMVALLIEDVTLTKAERVTLQVRFRGGQTTTLEVDKPKPIAQIRKTFPEVVAKIDALLETCGDQEVAAELNALGHQNWRGEPFTAKKITNLRNAYHLVSHHDRLRARGMLTAHEVAAQLKVSTTTVYYLGRAGIVQVHRYGNNDRRCLYAPPGDVVVVKGQGGRYRSMPPRLIPVQSTEQGAI
ncbi:recombinase family protein [Acidithiobacillus ferrivorans]|uniref:recombinase family protein n=1 Tax=Acidithiobacillus ferrivorans TaxID=160808 RepID=UPI001C06B020|nr:recombinase family protein [Acidithiobacillus ferrivorans]MBU2851555.1 recombinase family protein [Acidithiobacillus ferrivorans]